MLTMFFSGGARETYRNSHHKDRIDRLGRNLLAQRYDDDAIRHHVHEWLRFTEYLDEHDVESSTASPDIVRQYVIWRTRRRGASHYRFVRASTRIFLEADETGQFRRRVGAAPLIIPVWFRDLLSPYLDFVERHRGLSPRVVHQYRRKLSVFAQYLQQAKIDGLTEIAPRHVREFYENAGGDRPRRSYGSTLRAFFRWASTQSLLRVPLTDAVPRPRRYRFATLPDVLSQAEVDRILTMVDVSTPRGQRDRAVLLLAARYGLRPCDIRQLTLDQIDWRHSRVAIQQAKTGRALELPLLPDVADALSRYLREGRPASRSRVIFIRHRAPFEPFVAANNLSAIMGAALRRADLGDRPGRRGLYLLRHTLATRLLAAGRPLKQIADVLGHASTATTFGYARVDIEGLRTVAISEAEVRR
jgi:site-specific recombinase XerD